MNKVNTALTIIAIMIFLIITINALITPSTDELPQSKTDFMIPATSGQYNRTNNDLSSESTSFNRLLSSVQHHLNWIKDHIHLPWLQHFIDHVISFFNTPTSHTDHSISLSSPELIPSFTYNTSNLHLYCNDTSTTNGANITNRTWDFNNDNITDHIGPVVHYYYLTPGIYQIRLTITDEFNNTATITKNIPIYHYYVDDNYTLNTTGFHQSHFNTISTALQNTAENESIFVYNGTYHESIQINQTILLIGEHPQKTILNHTQDGIIITGEHTTVKQFTITSTTQTHVGDVGIQILNHHVTISDCVITNSYDGISCQSHHCTITDIIIIDIPHYAITFSYNSYQNNISQISITNATVGVMFQGQAGLSQQHQLQNSSFFDCHTGIYLLFNASSLRIGNNTFQHNQQGILSLLSMPAVNNTIHHNHFFNQSDTGINLSHLTRGFTLFHNQFQANHQHAYDQGNNTWYHPILGEGNYWDDYHGADADDNGIGDNPYLIPGGLNSDLYPLMMQDPNGNHPPDTPCGPVPSDEGIDLPRNINLSWTGTDPDDNDSLTYTLYFGSSNPPPLHRSNLSSNSSQMTSLQPETNYYWQIMSTDNHSASTTGPIWRFTTAAYQNHPPFTPSDPQPADFQQQVQISTNLSWQGEDMDPGDTVFYDLYFSAEFPPEQIISNHPFTSYDPGLLSYNTTYYWMIVAHDNHDALTAGPLWQFTTAQDSNTPPYEASHPQPYDLETDVSINPQLSWMGGDPDAEMVTYTLYFDTNNPPSETVSDLHQPFWNPTEPLPYDTTYYWQIKTTDELGKTSMSPRWCFTTLSPPNHPPLPANTPFPADTADEVTLPQLTLSWEAADPDDDPLQFTVYLGENSSTPNKVLATDLTSAEYHVDSLKAGTLYSWQVYSYDTHGVFSIAPIWTFTTATIENLPPLAANNPNPVDESTVNLYHPLRFDWNGDDPDDDTLRYDLYFGNSSPPSVLVTDLSSSSYEYHDTLNLSVNITYYWQVLTHDEHGATTMSETWQFSTYQINNTIPNIPHDPVPADNTGNVSRLITLQWQGGDPDNNDTVSYDFYLDETNPPTTKITTVSMLHYSPSNLMLNTTYYWKIEATDQHNQTTTGPVWSFTTKTRNQPPIPVITGPSSGYKNTQLSFSANTSTDTDGSIVSYSWDMGDGTKKTGISVQHSYSMVGTYTVKLTIVDSDADMATETKQVSIITANQPPTSVSISGQATVTQNQTYTLTLSATDNDQDQISFSIDWDDGTTDTTGFIASTEQHTETHVYNTDGLYEIKATAIDEQNAQSATETHYLYVNPEETQSTTDKDEANNDEGFPWLWFILPIIIVAVFIVFIYYRRQQRQHNQQLPSEYR